MGYWSRAHQALSALALSATWVVRRMETMSDMLRWRSAYWESRHGAHWIREYGQWEYEGDTGTLLYVWAEAQQVVGLWKDDVPNNLGGVDLCLLDLGRAADLARIKAFVGHLPAEHWAYREPCFPPKGWTGAWPIPRSR